MKIKKENRAEVRESTLTICISPEEKERVESFARKVGVSMSTFTRMALIAFIEKKN